MIGLKGFRTNAMKNKTHTLVVQEMYFSRTRNVVQEIISGTALAMQGQHYFAHLV